jgi:hypothetical protein
MKNKWKEYFKQENAGVLFFATIIILIVCLFSLSRFIVFVESRPGVVLDDPLFHLFKAIDLNIPIFAFIYISILWCMLYLAKEEPLGLIIALQTYSLLVLVRMAMMYTVPLEPPMGTIDLQDPLVFIVGTGQKITKDLFFSGHTSILFMMILVTRKKWLKYVFLTNTFIVGSFVIIQKVHYTIDVLVAPFVAFTCYKIIIYLNAKYFTKSKY